MSAHPWKRAACVRKSEMELAFAARPRARPLPFHAAALAVGYESPRRSGVRAVYHPGYHGAFILDPDGHNVGVVKRQPLSQGPQCAPVRRSISRLISASVIGLRRYVFHASIATHNPIPING